MILHERPMYKWEDHIKRFGSNRFHIQVNDCQLFK